MTPTSIAVSRFASVGNTQPFAASLTWRELVEQLRRFKRGRCTLETCGAGEHAYYIDGVYKGCREKYVGAWSPAVYKPGTTRAADNVQELSLLVVDADHLDDAGLAQALARVESYRCLAHASHSDCPEDRSVRIVIALSRSVTHDEWPRFWRAAMSQLGMPADGKCVNRDRLYFDPCRPSDADYLFVEHDGAALDVDEVLRNAPPPEPEPEPERRRTQHTTTTASESVYDELARLDQGYVLNCISGTSLVNGERIELGRPNRSGKHTGKRAIIIDGKATSGFVDADGRVAHAKTGTSAEGPDGGPLASTWCRFYGHDDATIRKLLIEHVPELARFEEERRKRASTRHAAPASEAPPFDDVPHAAERTPLEDELGERRRRKQTAGPESPDADTEIGTGIGAGYGPGGGYRMNEIGNARRLVDAHRDQLRYVLPWRSWLAWDGKRWRRDDTGAAHRAAKAVAAAIYADVAALAERQRVAVGAGTAESAPIEELTKWARASSKRAAVEAMLALAGSESEIAAPPNAWDANPWLLCVANGTIDLRDGELRPHRQADMLTMLAPVEYDPRAPAPQWEAFLERVLPDADVRAWIQRYLGHALTGDVREQCLAFFVGGGANGKSVLLDVVLDVLGDYGLRAAPDLVLASHNERHPTELADLDGKRLVVCSEIEQGRQWAESTIKRITGDRTITARKMKQDFYTFTATHKIVVAANTRPTVRGTDDGIWRRMRLIPWTVQIPPHEQDRELPHRLLATEGPGILAWLVRGCLAWQREGLGSAQAIADATTEYRTDQDMLGRWIEDRCTLGHDLWQATSSLYESYVQWCEDEGCDPWARRTWQARMVERRGIAAGKRGPNNSVRALIGLARRIP